MEVLINVKEFDKKKKKKDLYTPEELIEIIEDLQNQIDDLREEKKEFEQQVEDNYRPLNAYELAGMTVRDFV